MKHVGHVNQFKKQKMNKCLITDGCIDLFASFPGKFYQIKVMSYSYIIPVLVEAIKEQQKQIESLQAEIKKLKETK